MSQDQSPLMKKDKDAHKIMVFKAITMHGCTMNAIADFLRLHYTTVNMILQ